MTTQDINTSFSRAKVTDEIPETDLEEPTKAELLTDVKTGLQQALAGEGRPAREALAEIRRKIASDANHS